MEKARERMDYLDVAKCIAIITVVIGHASIVEPVAYHKLFIYTFHMPLFFMVSGIVTRRHRHEYDLHHWGLFFRKNLLAVVVPYFIWALLYANFSFPNVLKILYASREALLAVSSNTSLWFLPCLFVARIFMELILWLSTCFKKIERHLFALIMAVPMFVIGFLLPDLSMNMGWPWCLKSAFVATGFMLVGYTFKERLLLATERPFKVHFAFLAVYTAIFLAVVLSRGEDIPFLRMNVADYPDILFMFLSSFPAIGAVFAMSIIIVKAFSGTKFISYVLWLGQNTFGIYVLHMPFEKWLLAPFIDKYTPFHDPSFGYCAVVTIITFIYSIILVKIIDRYIPQLLGKFRTLGTVEYKQEAVVNESADIDATHDRKEVARDF